MMLFGALRGTQCFIPGLFFSITNHLSAHIDIYKTDNHHVFVYKRLQVPQCILNFDAQNYRKCRFYTELLFLWRKRSGRNNPSAYRIIKLQKTTETRRLIMEKSFSYFYFNVRLCQVRYYKNHNASFHSLPGRNMAAHCSTMVFFIYVSFVFCFETNGGRNGRRP